ncbi:MAG: hypothetical protein ACRCZR_08375 [Cetobacterium sp.]
MQVTKWLDKSKIEEKNKDYSSILNTILEVKLDEEESNDKIFCKNIKTTKKFDEDKTIILNSKNIKFNKIDFLYESITPGEEQIEDRTSEKKGIIIVYNNGVNTNYIIDKNSEAQKIIRKLNGYTGRGEVEKNSPQIPKDFFNWLVKKVYNNENEFETNNSKEIKVDAIKGFKGNTTDALTKVSATGESVMNIISTLSFLLESGSITQINLAISYADHQNIDLTINDKGIISTDYLKYTGILTSEDSEISNCKLLLIIYLEILPIFFNFYKQEVEDGEWNTNQNIEFLKNVAKELSENVNKKIKDMQEYID